MDERRSALIVATDRYDDPALSELAAPAADAQALAEVLGDSRFGGFDVDVLYNATSSTISQRLEGLLRDRRPSDLVLLHFSCHGLKDESGELFLAATNTRPGLLVSTAVEAAVVNRLIRRSRAARIVLLLDCCYGGAFERGVVPRAGGTIDVGSQFAQERLGGSRGRAIITASSAMEYAFEGSHLADAAEHQTSVFTSALVEGIRTGQADRDQDGFVALGELYDFVFERVKATTPHQTPCKWEFDLQGDLHLARNPNRRVLPVPLPADLQALLDSSVVAARLGAVAELAHLAEADDLRLAAAAQVALRQLERDDSHRVQLAAREAVARGAPRLPDGPVELGRGVVGGPALTVDVPVEGSPLAKASQITTTGPVQASWVDGALRITVATVAAGRVAGQVTLRGPAGDATVEVAGEVAGTEPLRRDAAGSGTAEQPHALGAGTVVDPESGTAENATPTDGPTSSDSEQPVRPGKSRPARGPVLAAGVAALLLLAATLAVLLRPDGGNGDGGNDAGEVTRQQVTVPGTEFFTDTGVDVTEGQRITITADGVVFPNPEFGTGPEGLPNRPDYQTPLPTENHNALIGRIGESGPMFLVGPSKSFTASSSGRLMLGINDGERLTNSGAYEALVVVTDP